MYMYGLNMDHYGYLTNMEEYVSNDLKEVVSNFRSWKLQYLDKGFLKLLDNLGKSSNLPENLPVILEFFDIWMIQIYFFIVDLSSR